MSKTKIVVIQRKELIYTGIFVGLAILLILLFIFMFGNKKQSTSETMSKYKPGVYTTQLSLNDTLLNIEVVVDENHINSVNFVNIDESVSAMYPLLEPALEEIESQLSNNVDISEIVVEDQSKYTQTLLLETVKETLEKAKY
ncbi:MAG: hypothetical protein II992_04820 [Lachnospiraceae bacterium]|nr:hypothetical protein [Lachnospiraceae bacterium]